jgi:hypothetical protein
VEVLAERTDGTLLIRNLHDIGRISVQPVESTVEPDTEADFLCAVLNSQPVAAIVAGYTVSVSISTHVLEHVGIPRYDPANELHCEIAEVGRSARETGAADEAALERLVSRLWSPN